jgi:hypothetical protein
MRTILINLPERQDRLDAAIKELNKTTYNYEVVPAIKHHNGAYGLLLTWQRELKATDDNLTIFEDDVFFLSPPELIMQIPEDFDILYFGGTAMQPMEYYSQHLLRVKEMRATHAMLISNKCRLRLIELIDTIISMGIHKPIDMIIVDEIQKDGNCYCMNPMVAVQRKGWSDIAQQDVDYSFMLRLFERFKPKEI